MDLADWSGVPVPPRASLSGRYVRLEPLDPERHGAALYEASAAPGAEDRFRFLPDAPPADSEAFERWVAQAAAQPDPLFFAVVDRQTGRAEGRQALMRIDAANGVIEIGNILWGPRLARTRGSTEALFLFAELVFGLGYRRLEWKCNDENTPSKAAAERFGFRFEGVFRQHLVVKGRNRDTAWYAILDHEWEHLRPRYEAWLDPANFDAAGSQRTRLATACSGPSPHRA